MKYLVIEIQNNADGTMGNVVYAFDNRQDAEEKYHTVLMYAAKSNVMIHSCALLTQYGDVVKNEHFTHPVPETPSEE